MESPSTGNLTESVPRSASVLDESSDDDIKYETAPKTVFSDGALEAGLDDDTSDDDTESIVDNEEALDSTSSRGTGASPRQLFHPPEESDDGDETDDDVGTVSSSPSPESSPAADEKPVVAPPSDSGNTDEMWKYILPFLTRHQDSIPAKNWVRHVIHLPRVRDIKWNEPRIKDFPYLDSHPRDITALIVQVTGVEATIPCAACAQGKGPFIGCIMISPQASQESRDHVLACANCLYHCGQSMCSHNTTSVERRRDRLERLTHKKKIYNVKVLSDRARGAGKALKTDQHQHQNQHQQASRIAGDISVEEAPQLNLRIYQPSEIRNSEMASKDRSYKMIRGKDGEFISMCGALIPEGYDLDGAVPGRPWVCPIRSCRAVFKKIAGLGSHFSVSLVY